MHFPAGPCYDIQLAKNWLLSLAVPFWSRGSSVTSRYLARACTYSRDEKSLASRRRWPVAGVRSEGRPRVLPSAGHTYLSPGFFLFSYDPPAPAVDHGSVLPATRISVMRGGNQSSKQIITGTVALFEKYLRSKLYTEELPPERVGMARGSLAPPPLSSSP